MNFRILSQSGDGKMHAGQIIRYRVSVLPLVRMTWVTEITNVDELVSFCDEQREGPYSLWRHKHAFKEIDGGVVMTDEVTYAIPLGFIGVLVNALFVRREVNRIFDYRYDVLKSYFSSKQNNSA